MTPARRTFDPFVALCASRGLPEPTPEYRFHATRRWRFDYAWPEHRVALEVDGGVWTGGRHTRGGGWHRDTEKLNAAASLGWRLLRCTPDTLCTHEMVALVRQTLTPVTEQAS
jgi:very-short-patch-repair endonuclease